MGALDSKVFVMPGGARGVGRGIAEAFAREGARLVINDLGCDTAGRGADPEVVEEAVRSLRTGGGEAVGDAQDISEAGVPDALVRRALETYGRFDGVVDTVGIRSERSILKLRDEDLDRVLGVHLRASFALLRAAARALVDARQPGTILLSSSQVAFFAGTRQSAVAAADAGVTALVRSSAVELRKHGIRVNALAPTARTRLTEDLPLFRGIAEDSMTPQHVAPLAVFLCSDAGSDVSGEVLGVAGGRVYALRSRETTGAFAEQQGFTPDGIRDAWGEITRG